MIHKDSNLVRIPNLLAPHFLERMDHDSINIVNPGKIDPGIDNLPRGNHGLSRCRQDFVYCVHDVFSFPLYPRGRFLPTIPQQVKSPLRHSERVLTYLWDYFPAIAFLASSATPGAKAPSNLSTDG